MYRSTLVHLRALASCCIGQKFQPCPFVCTHEIMAARRVSFAGALVLCLAAAQIAAASCATLRGTVACLDCAPQRNLSGVVVAVKCANVTGLRAAETDGRGLFEVAMPTAATGGSGSGFRCAARILGGQEQLCAPPTFAASRVVFVPGRSRGSYALASGLAVFRQCASATATAVATTDAANDLTAPARGRLPGIDSPLGYRLGLPLSVLFPFFPVIGGGIP